MNGKTNSFGLCKRPFLRSPLLECRDIRTAKWPATFDRRCSEMDLDKEIACAAQLAARVLAALVGRYESYSLVDWSLVQSDG
jgi:hypothetical protein